MQILFVVFPLVLGFLVATYMPLNSSVARILGSSIAASVPFFIIALVTTILLMFVFGEQKAVLKIRDIPWYLFLSGFGATLMVWGTTFFIPRIGARSFFVLLVAGQVLMSMLLSHFGILESPRDPLTLKKIIGALLLLGGTALATL